MKSILTAQLLLLALVTTPCFAVPITAESTWTVWNGSEYLDGNLTFTYEDTTPDSNAVDWRGEYINCFTNFSFSIGADVWTFVPGMDSMISTSAKDHGYTSLAITGTVANSFGQVGILSLGLETFPIRLDDSLTNLAAQVFPYVSGAENHLLISQGGSFLVRARLQDMHQVPEPTILGLIAISILAYAVANFRVAEKG